MSVSKEIIVPILENHIKALCIKHKYVLLAMLITKDILDTLADMILEINEIDHTPNKMLYIFWGTLFKDSVLYNIDKIKVILFEAIDLTLVNVAAKELINGDYERTEISLFTDVEHKGVELWRKYPTLISPNLSDENMFERLYIETNNTDLVPFTAAPSNIHKMRWPPAYHRMNELDKNKFDNAKRDKIVIITNLENTEFGKEIGYEIGLNTSKIYKPTIYSFINEFIIGRKNQSEHGFPPIPIRVVVYLDDKGNKLVGEY